MPGTAVEIDERDVAQVAEAHRVGPRAWRQGGHERRRLHGLTGLGWVEVLRINELANVLKPVALPGRTRVLREGRDRGHGVARVDAGAMVAVEQGRRHIGQAPDAVATSVLRATAGRMIFERPREDSRAPAPVLRDA